MKKFLSCTAATAAVLFTGTAVASNGYFSHGYGTRSKGMAGAGVALPLDAMSVATNPANLIGVGDRVDAGLGLFIPMRGYTVDGNPSGGPGSFPMEPGSQDSGSELFPIPHFAMAKPIDEVSAWGVAVYGNGGLNTDYAGHANPVRNQGGTCPSGTYCAGATGVDLAQLFVALTYARAINSDWSFGVTPVLAAQRFKAEGLGSFAGFSSDPLNLSNNGYDMAYGYALRLGVSGKLTEQLSVGLSWSTRTYMSEFDKYAGLFAEQGDLDIPSNGTVGLAWATSETSTLLFDVQYINYSEVASINNPFLPNLMTAQLGSDAGAGFGWESMTIYKLGYQWALDDNWTWRVGYSYGEQPIPTSEVVFNMIAPGVIEQHLTTGFSKRIGKTGEVTAAVMYAPEKSVKGVNPLDPVQTVDLHMDQYELEVGYSWLF